MFKKHILIALAVAGTLAFAEPIERRAATNEFPTPPATVHLTAPMVIKAGTTFTPDQPYTRYDRGSGACKSSGEGGSADAVFHLEEGATISRVVIGKDQMEGIHCLGSCTIDHVYFEDVCEDAITILQTSGTSRINYGGAKGAQDKTVQHNGGGTVIINSFYVENFGKLYLGSIAAVVTARQPNTPAMSRLTTHGLSLALPWLASTAITETLPKFETSRSAR